MEGIGGLEITIARGRPVVPLPEGDRYLGFLFARGASAGRGRALPARRARLLRILIEPHAPEPVQRALAWVSGARPADLDLRAGPPAVARRLAGGRAAPRRARGPLPGSQRRSRGTPAPWSGRRRSASRCRCTPPCAWRSARRADVRREHPGLPICFYGLYATVSRELVERRARRARDRRRVRAGAHGLGRRAGGPRVSAPAARTADHPPAARRASTCRRATCCRGSSATPAWRSAARSGWSGYVEASHGCVHRCRHCPVPAVYDGRIRVVQAETVLRDIERLVEHGRAPHHVRRPRLPQRPPPLAARSCGRCTSASRTSPSTARRRSSTCSSTPSCGRSSPPRAACSWSPRSSRVNDEILDRLDKGHTTEEAVRAIALLREHGIEMRPSFMPFTPWTTPA